jgi:hypothetical protein
MAVATLFDSDKDGKSGKSSWVRSMLTGGFGAEADVPRVAAPPRPAAETQERHHESEAESQPTPSSTPSSAPLGRSAYLRGLEEVIRRTEREEVQETLVSVSPAEVQTLVRKAAKAKARYLAAVLDTAEGESLPDTAAVKSMEAARERHEALEAGLQNLLAEMRRGSVDIQGIDEDGQTPSADT